jgi:hypothetical protein
MTSIIKVDQIQNAAGTAGLTINNDGVVALPKVVAMSRSLAQQSSYGTYTDVPFATVNYEFGFTANAAATEFTLTYGGVYVITWTALSNQTVSNKLALYVNGSFRSEAYAEGGSSGNAQYSTLSNQIIISLNAGDIIKLNTHNHDGAFYQGTHGTINAHRIG